jgi:hypothetical protein
MDGVFLIVRADDFGLCHAANQAVCEGFEAGILTCASLAVVGPWVAEAADLIHAHPEWEIGLQLMLHCDTAGCRWGPVAGPAAVPNLVDATGNFLPQLSAAAAPEEIARELQAQVDRAKAWDFHPCYLEYPAEATPAVTAVLHQLSERLGLPARMADWGLQFLLNDQSSSPANLPAALDRLSPGHHLWVVRPAWDSPETWGLWPDDQARRRQADAQALGDPDVLACIRRRGIELIGFRELVEDRVGSPADKE